MTGGTIRNCFIKDGSGTEFGGNLYVEYGEVDMTGGTIENGGIPAQGQTVTPDKTHQGGNICVRGNSVVNISGTATVQNGGNAKYGANIFLNIGSANITGGTIGGVSANSIYLANTNTSRLTIDGATVKGIGDGNETNVASRLSIWFAGAKPNTSTAPITLGAYTGLLTLNPDVSNDSLANYPVGMVVNNVTLNEHYDLEKEIFIYDSSSSRKPLAVNADKKLQIAGLTGIKKADGVAVPVTKIDNTAGTYAYYEIYTAGTYTMKSDAVIDPNNRTCTIDNTNFKLSLIDNRTRDFEVDEQLRSGISVTNPDNLEPIGVNELTGERFLVVDSGLTDANGNPYYTANYLEVELKTVSLKTNKADLYYTTAVKSNYLGAKAVEQYGVAFSLKAPVGDDFHMENVYNTNGILFTVNEYVAEDKTMLDETAVSALVENVLVEGAEDNAERAELTIYASAYVKVNLFNGNVAYVMSTADTDFNYHQIIEKLDTQLGADATKFEGKESVITGFYNAWLAPLNWELPNIKALAAA